MTDMAKHSTDPVAETAGKPLHRARLAAWSVFVLMAGTTMAFQTYHSIKYGRMPWELAYLYGIVPLAICIGVLEFASRWGSAWAQKGAYAVAAGAMFLSASATGKVTAAAAPPHAQLLFGFLMDGAALLAVRFIMTGPAAGEAVAEVARKIGELTAAANAERAARQEAEANAVRTERELRAGQAANLAAERQANEKALARLAAEAEEARETERRETDARQRAEAELAAAGVKLAAAQAGREGADAARQAADRGRDEALARTERQLESLRAQLDAARSSAAMRSAAEAERDAARRELETVRTERDAALSEREEAERSAANAEAKAERLARKFAPQGAAKSGRAERKAPSAMTAAEAREEAHRMLDKDPDITGKALAEPFGMTPRWGEMRKQEHALRNGLRAVESA